MNQAYKLSFEDLGELSASETKDLDSKEYFNTYWAPYIKALTYCETITPCGYKSYTPFTQTNGKKVFGTLLNLAYVQRLSHLMAQYTRYFYQPGVGIRILIRNKNYTNNR